MHKPAREWATFIRIRDASHHDIAPSLDPEWCAARGVYSGAEEVLRLLRNKVLPLIRTLERSHGLRAYHFLVHDRASGVPTSADDRGAYIHLRLSFKHAIQLDKWIDGWNASKKLAHDEHESFDLTRPAGRTTEIGGVDLSIVKKRSVRRAWELIDAQSRWVLDFVESHDWKDDAQMIRQVRQYLHYFANMLQVRVVG